MVTKLKKAIKEVEKLPIKKQKAIAEIILDEIKWDLVFQNTQENLSELAVEAINEHRSGKTRPDEIDLICTRLLQGNSGRLIALFQK